MLHDNSPPERTATGAALGLERPGEPRAGSRARRGPSAKQPQPGRVLALPLTDREVQITKPGEQFNLEVSLHELAGTTKRTIEEVLGVLAEFGIPLEEQPYGTRLYKQRWAGPYGVSVQWGNKCGSDEVHVRLPGESCEVLGLESLVGIATLLELSATSLHAAIDYCPFKPRALWEARDRGLIRTHAQAGEMILGDDGDTFYLGSSMSDVRLCCYDKRGFTRSELRFRNKHARAFLAGVMARPAEQLVQLALGALRAFVDFVDSTADSNITRCPLLPFWADFIELFAAVRVAPKKAAASLRGFIEHVRKNAATFRTYVACMVAQGNSPEHVALEFLAHGEQKMRTRHRSLIVAAEHARAWCPA